MIVLSSNTASIADIDFSMQIEFTYHCSPKRQFLSKYKQVMIPATYTPASYKHVVSMTQNLLKSPNSQVMSKKGINQMAF